MIYTVTFNPAIDYVVHTDAMQVGMVNRSRTEEIYYGGKGINVSMVLKELGLESRALGFVAGFTGAAIEKGVQAKGIATDFVHLQEGFSRINVKIKSGEETELNGQGPAIGAEAVVELFRKLDKLRGRGHHCAGWQHSQYDAVRHLRKDSGTSERKTNSNCSRCHQRPPEKRAAIPAVSHQAQPL